MGAHCAMMRYAAIADGYFFGVPAGSLPSACMRTLTRSVGLAMQIASAPVVRPAAIFRWKGTSPFQSGPT
jgi:hypothetical protein